MDSMSVVFVYCLFANIMFMLFSVQARVQG